LNKGDFLFLRTISRTINKTAAAGRINMYFVINDPENIFLKRSWTLPKKKLKAMIKKASRLALIKFRYSSQHNNDKTIEAAI
jgi:hypothetical protein